MRQSQQERRIAVQLMHVRHEKEVLWQNRIFREKQHEERRLKDFQDALDREAALAKQAKIDFEEQFLKEKRFHDQIAVERAQARYEKHYSVCAEILDQIVDLSTKVADYRMLTNNLIPYKLMHDWKELFFNAKPIYEQASVKTLPADPSREQLTELEKRDLLDTNDYEEYKIWRNTADLSVDRNMVGEWALPEEMVDNLPPSNNCILGHILHRLVEKSLPPRAESTTPELPSFAVKGCLLGKTLSGKTTILRSLQKDFPIQILSIDTLVQEAIQAFHDNEKVSEVLPIQKKDEEDALPVLQEEIKESQDPQHVFSAGPVSDEVLPETEGETILSGNADKTPKAEEVKSSDSFLKLTTRAQLGAKSEQLLKKGKSIPDVLLVDIMVNAINKIPVNQDCILDGFPMTLNQAQLLEEALTGCNRNLTEVERKKAQKSTLAIDPATSKEIPLPSPAFDFVILLDVSDTSSMSRMNDIIAEELSYKTAHEDISQRVAAENQDKDGDQNLRDQIQHRIIGFLDNWPLLEQWFSEPENILIKINAEIDKESLCEKVKEILTTEIAKKKNKVEKKLEEKEAEKKAAASLAELPLPTPPPAPPPEPEKEKEIHQSHVPSKTPTAKGKPQSEAPHGKQESLQEGKGKKGETALKRKGSPKGKSSGGKVPVKKSPADSTDTSPVAIVPQPPKPGSEEWVYVNEPVPEEMPSFLVPYWELIENSYINTIKTVLRHLREDQHTVLAYLYEIRTSFQEFLKRPDHKQDFVAQWQADFNSLPDDLWDDEETKAELHQRVNDLRDRLWDICDVRKEEAEQERLDIINKSWLQDTLGMTMNHFFSLMQAELNRFQDTKRLLQDYYWGMESKIPVEDNKRFTQIPLVQLDSKDNSESQLRIPLVPRISISLETVTPKPKTKSVLKSKTDNSLENVESNFEADEKLVMDTWQQASLAVSHMVAAEIHQRLMEEEKENQPADPKEKSPQMGANKKVKKEPPKKKQEDKKPKGKSSPMAEATPVIVTTEEIAEIKRKNELRVKIKEEHLAALQFEEIATQFRLELIKTKALALLEDLVTKVVDVYKLMEKWLGERYLNEMASIEKLTDVARYHIETSTKIQNELYLSQEDFFINGNIKVFPDPPPPIRPPPVEKEEDGTLTIEQLDSLRDQFLDMAPNGIIGNKAFTDILIDLVTLNLGTNNFPSSWMHLTQPELQELTSLLTVNSEFVDWRKFLLVTSMPWPVPSEEELLETLQKFKAVDKEQLGTITFEQYMQAGLWFTGDEDIKIPENPLEPLPFNRQEHLIEFFFRLFADYKKDPPQLDYTQMLLYFACHPDTVEGAYRALSVAVGTHVFQQVKASIPSAEKTSSTDAGPAEEFPEPEGNAAREERKLKDDREKREQKDEEIPENANNEKMSMETLLKVFKGGSEAQDSNRFASHLKIENIYAEGFIKTFQDLGAKNLEPIEVAVLLKHPFIQDLISNYSDYKFPVHIIYVVEMIVCAKGWAPLPSGKQCARWRN
ncbi:sperm flagellar protein 2 isoform X16 [Pan troglodytes]|nr:sperm flagellar protein 2 isoform X15 [Pan troglodytes]